MAGTFSRLIPTIDPPGHRPKHAWARFRKQWYYRAGAVHCSCCFSPIIQQYPSRPTPSLSQLPQPKIENNTYFEAQQYPTESLEVSGHYICVSVCQTCAHTRLCLCMNWCRTCHGGGNPAQSPRARHKSILQRPIAQFLQVLLFLI